jgi:hypothetical protein
MISGKSDKSERQSDDYDVFEAVLTVYRMRGELAPPLAPPGEPMNEIKETGIDLTKQKIGTIITVETEDERLFEMIVKIPERGIVEISGTEPRLKNPVLGVLTHSFSGDKHTQINHWIGMLLKMSLVFKNGNYESQPVVHASVKGPGWSYSVF